MKKSALFLLYVFVCVAAASDYLSKIYSADDQVYYWIEQLSIETGISPLSSASPWSGYELSAHMERINYDALSDQGKKVFDDVYHSLHGSDTTHKFSATGKVTPEGYLNLNNENFSPFRDWIYDYSQRMPFWYLEADAVIGEHFYGIFSVEARRRSRLGHMFSDPGVKNAGPVDINHNAVITFDGAEHGMPYTAFAGHSKDGHTFSMGRDTLSWGRGKTGNLFISGHAPYHDFISYNAFGDFLTYRLLAMQFDEIHPSTGRSMETDFYHTMRLFTAHRIEARLSPRLTVTAAEGTLFLSNKMDIRMFSPTMFLHNYFNFDQAKNFMHFDIEFAPAPGMLLYTQMFIDQLQVPSELANYNEGELFPNAFGVLSGVQFSRPHRNGFVTGYLEGALTSTYLYLRRNLEINEGSPLKYQTDHWNLDLVQASNITGRRGINFLGYPYGPDTVIASAQVKYTEYSHAALYADATFGIQGEKGLKIDGKDQMVETGRKYLYQFTPSGDAPEVFLKSGFGGEYYLQRYPLKLYGSIHTLNRWNAGNVSGAYLFDLQLVLGANISLRII